MAGRGSVEVEAVVGVRAGDRTGDDVGGYRLVRRLGSGPAADVHLAVPIAGGDAVAIKLARRHRSQADVLAEVHALWRARGPHVVPVLDVIDRDGGAPALVLERVPTSLSTLLRSSIGIGAPAAATVLLPVAATVRRIHRAGIAHGRLTPSAIRLDEHGAPVLVGFGGATLFVAGASPAVVSATPAVIEDVRAFRRLAIAVLESGGATTGDLGVPIAELGDDDAVAADAHEWLERFEALVFEHVTPGPVPIAAVIDAADGAADQGGGQMSAMSARGATVAAGMRGAGSAATGSSADDRWRRARRPARRGATAIAGALDDLGARVQAWGAARLPDGVATAAGPLVRRLLASVGPVRARAWVPAALVAVALVAAIVVIPLGDGDAAVDASNPTSSQGSGVGPSPRNLAGVESDPTPGSASPIDPASAADPEVAVIELLERRAECLGDRDAECIAGVVQTGGPAESADLSAIAAAPDGSIPGASWRVRSAVLVDLLGGAALVDATVETPAGIGTVPVLLVLSEGQWRIRAILAEPSIVPQAQP